MKGTQEGFLSLPINPPAGDRFRLTAEICQPRQLCCRGCLRGVPFACHRPPYPKGVSSPLCGSGTAANCGHHPPVKEVGGVPAAAGRNVGDKPERTSPASNRPARTRDTSSPLSPPPPAEGTNDMAKQPKRVCGFFYHSGRFVESVLAFAGISGILYEYRSAEIWKIGCRALLFRELFQFPCMKLCSQGTLSDGSLGPV